VSKALIPVVLSGGSGTRLWPLSRADRPKQFLNFGGGETLIEATLRRCSGQGFDPRPIIVAAESHRFMVRETVNALGLEADILLEPMRRDSCAAIVAGALQALQRDKDALILVVAADHHILDAEAFAVAALSARDAAEAGWLVTFGIKPTAPATGYGYILPGQDAAGSTTKRIARFVEKPDRATAEAYLTQGFVWNSGNFLFKAAAFLEQAQLLVPDIVRAMTAALAKASHDMGFLRLDAQAFAASPQISVDFAIMEKTGRAAVKVVDYLWSDIGSWDAVAGALPADASDNSVVGTGFIADSRNVSIHSIDRLTTVLGCDGLVVVTTRDAVMVCRKGQTEAVKQLVETLKAAGHREAEGSLRHYRPWGNHEVIDQGPDYEVRRIVIAREGAISLQSHGSRSEHWILVQGSALATVGDHKQALTANGSLTIPAGKTHSIRNTGDGDLILIEVHTGVPRGEADTTRYS
jgi:mannose-1-phosphate guanylyltransferase / mannose-6-phosphate isomerase